MVADGAASAVPAALNPSIAAPSTIAVATAGVVQRCFLFILISLFHT
jgi:hypothetical protein